MRVACPRCDARYEFAAKTIPAAGYRAECRHCRAEFFVSPDSEEATGPQAAGAAPASEPSPATTDAAPPKRQSRLDRLFEADLHEDVRLDAIDLVDLHQDEAAPPKSADSVEAPPAATSRPGRAYSLTDSDDEKDLGDSNASNERRRPVSGRGSQPMGTEDNERHAAAYAKSRRDSRRAGLAEGASEERPTRTRPRMFVGVAATLLVALGVVVGVVRSKSLHAPTQVTPPVGIIRDPGPEARAALHDGLAALALDSTASLAAAIRDFQRAKDLEPQYTDAWAGLALAAWLAGTDGQQDEQRAGAAEGQAVQGLSDAAIAQGREASAVHLAQGQERGAEASAALSLAASSLRLRAAVHDLQLLHNQQVAGKTSAWAHLLWAGSLLLHAQQLPAQSPLVATVAALWHSDAEQGDELVGSQLAVAEQLIGQQLPPERRSWLGEPSDQNDKEQAARSPAPFVGWRLIAEGRLSLRRAGEAGSAAEQQRLATLALNAFAAAKRLEPELRRADYLQAEALIALKRVPEARDVLVRLSSAQPPHARAGLLLAELTPP